MKHNEFKHYAQQGFNRIPVTCEILADLDTALSTYLKLGNQAYSYLLESMQGGERWGRYSIIGLPCQTLIKVCKHELTIEENGQIQEQKQVADPLAFIERYYQNYKVPNLPQLPRFAGGLVGYFGYETIQYIEPRLAHKQPVDDLKIPDILLMLSNELAVFDNLSGKILLIVYVDPQLKNAYEAAQNRLVEIQQKLLRPIKTGENLRLNTQKSEGNTINPHYYFPQVQYEAAIGKIKKYILAGDVMQVVPSQRMAIPFTRKPLDLYRALRLLNPSPYLYYFDLGNFNIVGSSPEILARVEKDQVIVRPIAGTRPRGATPEEDLALEQELLADPKEIAEHLMLIDLGRNDIGRIVQSGTVKVTDQMFIERYSHVMHIVSNVVGQLKPNMTAMDVLKATFPAGTLTGAPKIRAMEIIAELEPVKRNIYGGAVGYWGWNGNMDMAIAIRTAVIKNQQLYVQAGGGVVADSVPHLEWQETMNKSKAILKAAEWVMEKA